jgi:hypothetical protein
MLAGRAPLLSNGWRSTRATWASSGCLAMFDDMLLAQSAVDRFKNSAYDFLI